MAEPHRPPLPPPSSRSGPSPLPTPPSSTTTIPPLCFPSPTSVADVVNAAPRDDQRKKVLRERLQAGVPGKPCHAPVVSHNKSDRPAEPIPTAVAPPAEQITADTSDNVREDACETERPHDDDASVSVASVSDSNSSETRDDIPKDEEFQEQGSTDPQSSPDTQPAPPQDEPFYYRPELANPSPSEPMDRVTKTQFVDALDTFVAYDPPNPRAQPTVLANRIRELLDHLDALVEQLSLRVTNKLFDALSHPRCLAMLLFLLSDVSARSTPVMKDVRKSYRYPYLVTNILANGNLGIRESFMASKPLVGHLLSFLDGDVTLSTAPDSDSPQPCIARNNPIIVGNVVQILVSYLETSPESLLEVFESRPTFIPSIVNLLDTGSVPKLLMSLIPDRCVDDVASMDHCNVVFDNCMSKALDVLHASSIFHHLAEAFVRATQTIFSVVTNSDGLDERDEYIAEQLAYNVMQVYTTLVNKTIRAVRINTSSPACQYLNVFATPETACTVSQILRAGTDVFRGTKMNKVSILDTGLSMTIQLLRYVEQDRERRVASVIGQPPPLDTSGLEAELEPVLRELMSVLIDTVNTGQKHSNIRLCIVELFVDCMRVCSPNMLSVIDKLRFGEVALKVMLKHPRNSLMQHVICRGVETALISPAASAASARHWLVRSKLVQKVMRTWEAENGDERWTNPAAAQESPFLSALVQMACCVQHYLAMQSEKRDGDMPTLTGDTLAAFEAFCAKSLGPILAQETALCGPKPRRRPSRPAASIGRSFGVMGRTTGVVRRTGGAHLVRSPSAHRFGYVPPVSSLRSRFDEVFVEGEEEEFEAGRCSSLASVFDIGDVSDALG